MSKDIVISFKYDEAYSTKLLFDLIYAASKENYKTTRFYFCTEEDRSILEFTKEEKQ